MAETSPNPSPSSKLFRPPSKAPTKIVRTSQDEEDEEDGEGGSKPLEMLKALLNSFISSETKGEKTLEKMNKIADDLTDLAKTVKNVDTLLGNIYGNGVELVCKENATRTQVVDSSLTEQDTGRQPENPESTTDAPQEGADVATQASEDSLVPETTHLQKRSVTLLVERLTSLEAKVERQSSNFNRFSLDLKEHGISIDSKMSNATRAHESSVKNIDDRIMSLFVKLEKMISKLEQKTETNVKKLETKMEDNTKNVLIKMDKVTELQRSLGLKSSQQLTILSEMKSTLANPSGEMELKDALANLTNVGEIMYHNVARLSKRVEELAASEDITPTDLEAAIAKLLSQISFYANDSAIALAIMTDVSERQEAESENERALEIFYFRSNF